MRRSPPPDRIASEAIAEKRHAFDGTTQVFPAPASFGEAAVALMLARARDGSEAELLAELRVLAESRSPAARLWDAYAHGRPLASRTPPA